MNTTPLTEQVFFYKLEREEISRETWKEFVSTYCHRIYVGPWLPSGSMTVGGQIDLWNPRAHFGIVLRAGKPRDPWPLHMMETLFHELIHIACYVIGMEEHSEESVEKLCKILARKYPFIFEIFEEVFSGLKFTEQFFTESFENPRRIFLPLIP